ncbi:hypothetical protein [Allorhizobium taibaishanense]|uniref:Uncharacterized protein n=1 Tax=Allorhizobium taibaishanense TaxID=887144 RepID=A0A1Q9A9K4_9HYPH|nr:hypothetical protein [Allorhizobium taibaishanense]MBB4009935.1 hypothetical protein [Allorhizobium taibaishanense]OLP51559.1 hypothetical protein BJF91_16080 [Allorhizobium taibaishanense]
MPIAASMFSFDLFGLTRHRANQADTQPLKASQATPRDDAKICKDSAVEDNDRNRFDYHAVILGGFFPIL